MDRIPVTPQFALPGLFNGRRLAVLAFASALLPTLYTLMNTLWATPDQEHGPIILVLVLWLFWRKRGALAALPDRSSGLGWAALLGFALSYGLGRSQGIYFLETGSFILLVSGWLLLEKGWAGVRVMWFPLFFMLYLLPLPGPVIDAITAGLKESVSHVAEAVLYWAGYPIARNGVVLNIGQYQLLVADACSGLNSMFSLSALGFLFVHITQPPHWWQRVIIILALLPIAFIANVVRVMALVLLTYYRGDAAGQGFMHTAAGLTVFVVALVLVGTLGEILMRMGRHATKRSLQ
ncbi:exosortase B [Silvimonas amylolytica]|uniref:Exosortase n=1 Tax=Silvimonas amylolytica TaxID=449663 RepID=A0ABQ2PSE4_9NEIS|nr:exosortase B [Silvimonas amylolytica]GGP27884.1 exosortase [Silvimonas amylolytica]